MHGEHDVATFSEKLEVEMAFCFESRVLHGFIIDLQTLICVPLRMSWVM